MTMGCMAQRYPPNIFEPCLINGKCPIPRRGGGGGPYLSAHYNGCVQMRYVSPTHCIQVLHEMPAGTVPWLAVDTGIVSRTQTEHIDQKGMNVLSMTGNSRPDCTLFSWTFVRLPHGDALEENCLPQPLVENIWSVYQDSFLQVICRKQFTGQVHLGWE